MTATLHDMPCPECGHSTMGHDYDAICWGTRDCQCEMSRNEVAQRNHERIVAARVGEVVMHLRHDAATARCRDIHPEKGGACMECRLWADDALKATP